MSWQDILHVGTNFWLQYLPRNGVATPAQIIEAIQIGFNMEFELAAVLTYGAFLVNGNHLTNLLSIGMLPLSCLPVACSHLYDKSQAALLRTVESPHQPRLTLVGSTYMRPSRVTPA